MNLRGKIIRFEADTLWDFRAAEVIEDKDGRPDIAVRHFDMTTERIRRGRILGFMDNGKFVGLNAVDAVAQALAQMTREERRMTKRLADILRSEKS
jgi:hypothetical protein